MSGKEFKTKYEAEKAKYAETTTNTTKATVNPVALINGTQPVPKKFRLEKTK